VTYKWPRWLHKQTEKQRIIWAYKILFLDVLFPLNLEKVGNAAAPLWHPFQWSTQTQPHLKYYA
jgi:hypothetical protein